MVVIAQPETVKLNRKGKNTLQSEQLSVSVDAKTGNITFRDAKGNVLLREKKCEFVERAEGPDKGTYRSTLPFLSPLYLGYTGLSTS